MSTTVRLSIRLSDVTFTEIKNLIQKTELADISEFISQTLKKELKSIEEPTVHVDRIEYAHPYSVPELEIQDDDLANITAHIPEIVNKLCKDVRQLQEISCTISQALSSLLLNEGKE